MGYDIIFSTITNILVQIYDFTKKPPQKRWFVLSQSKKINNFGCKLLLNFQQLLLQDVLRYDDALTYELIHRP